MGNRIWSVVVVDMDGNVQMQHHVTEKHDTADAYADVCERIKTHESVVAMIPGNHLSGSTMYSLGRYRKNTAAWIDPFELPENIDDAFSEGFDTNIA